MNRAPAFRRDLLRGSLELARGIVEEHVHGLEALEDHIHERGDLIGLADVAGDGQGLCPRRLDLGARRLERLGTAGFDLAGRIAVQVRRTPVDLERETGALDGAIYGEAPHGRLVTLRRPGPRVRGLDNVLRVGGTAHPGGGLPLVGLSAEIVAGLVGPA